MGYGPCILAIFGSFQNALIFFNISCFLEPFFASNNLNVLVETLFACFRQFYFLTQTEYFCMGYSLCIMAIFGIY